MTLTNTIATEQLLIDQKYHHDAALSLILLAASGTDIDERELDLHRNFERIIGEELAKRAGFLYYGDKLSLL